jgi:hypothetical protein
MLSSSWVRDVVVREGEDSVTSLVAARSALGALEGRPFTALGRAATLAWFAFGDEVPWVNYRGEHTTRSELALHLQCRWRLVRGATALVQKGVLYVPGARAGAAFDTGAKIGTSRFDDRVETVSRIIAAEVPVVEHVRIGDAFDLQLTLSSGVSGDGHHYVVENGSVYAV